MVKRALVITCYDPDKNKHRIYDVKKNYNDTIDFCKAINMETTGIFNCSLGTLRRNVKNLSTKQTEEDALYVFIHCHSNKGEFIIGYTSTNPEQILKYSELRELLDTIPGLKIMFIDSCLSGDIIDEPINQESVKEVVDAAKENIESLIDAFKPKFRKTRTGELRGEKYKVLCACRNNEASIGEFTTQCWLKGMGWDTEKKMLVRPAADINGTNMVSMQELEIYSRKETSYSDGLTKIFSWHVQAYPENDGFNLVRYYVKSINVSWACDALSAKRIIPDGYNCIDKDLNKGAGGRYIYLSYLLTISEDEALTNFLVTYFGSSKSSDTVTLVDSKGYQTSYYRNAIDLNKGAGGKYEYICSTKDKHYTPISAIKVQFGATPEPSCGWEYVTYGSQATYADLNKGTYGDRISLLVLR